MAVSIPGAFIADPLRARRADRYFQFLLNDELDSAPNSLPHQLFQRAFPLPFAPAIPLHSVILRCPPASGCELWLNSPDLDAFLLFHQLPDTAVTGDANLNPFGDDLIGIVSTRGKFGSLKPPWPQRSSGFKSLRLIAPAEFGSTGTNHQQVPESSSPGLNVSRDLGLSNGMRDSRRVD